MFALYDQLNFMPVVGIDANKSKEHKIRIGIGAGIGGVVCLTIVDDHHKPLTHIKLEPEQATEIGRSLVETAAFLYGTA